MTISITINGTITTDETGIVGDGDDNNVASFPSAISSELSSAISTDGVTTPAASSFFPTFAEKDGGVSIGGATGTVSVSFADATGALLSGVDSGLKTDTGLSIFLYTSPSNNLIVYGIAQSSPGSISSGTLVFSIVLQETFDTSGALTGGNLFIEQYQAIHNDSATNTPDDISILSAVTLHATQVQEITFSDFTSAPSGQDLWAGITRPGTGNPLSLLVSGIVPNASSPTSGDRVNISTTGLGENSQGIGQNEGVRIDFVNNVTTPETSTTVHDASKLTYTEHVLTNGAGWSPVQTNPTKARVSALMVAFNDTDNSTGAAYFDQISTLGSTGESGSQTRVAINTVKVFDAAGVLLGSATRDGGGSFTDPNLSASFISLGALQVNGMLSDYHVQFSSTDQFDRFTVTNITSRPNVQFDVGNVELLATSSSGADAALNVAFEDDGPTAVIAATSVNVTHDESAGAQTAGGATDTNSGTVAALFSGVGNPSTDAAGDDQSGNIFAQSASAAVTSTGSSTGADTFGATTVFSLSVAPGGVDSGLQTTDGTGIFLFQEGSLVVGRIGSTATLAQTGQAAIAVAIDGNSGVLSLAQYASLKQPIGSVGDTSEGVSITNSALQAVVTVTDGDGDVATNSTDIGNAVVILDDGPTAAIALTGTTVSHDESVGFQADDNSAAATPFAGVTNTSTNLPVSIGPDDRFALSASAVVTSTGSAFGADEEGATTAFSLAISTTGVDSGLRATYAPTTAIVLTVESGLVVGRVGSGGPAAFAVAIDSSTGVVSIAQYAALVQPTASLGDTSEAVSINNTTLQAVVTVTDGDGDTATKSVNIGSEVKFLDDGPSSYTPTSVAVVDFSSGTTTGGIPLNEVPGVDQFASHQITSFTAPSSLPSVLSTLKTSLTSSSTVLTYYKDANNNNIVDGGEAFFRLTLNSNNTYAFDVLQNAPPVTETLNFSALKSGSPVETLTVAAGTSGDKVTFDGLIFNNTLATPFTSSDTETGSGATALSTYNLGASSTDDDLNPDSIGFGEKSGQASQMNPNEGWFAVNKDAQGNFLPMQGINFAIQGIGSVPSVQVDWITFDRNSSGGNSTFNSVGTATIPLPSGNNAVPFSIPAGDADGFEVAYVRYTYPGQGTNVGVRNINFSITAPGAFPDSTLTFGVAVADGDGDTKNSGTFTVGLDGNHDGIITA